MRHLFIAPGLLLITALLFACTNTGQTGASPTATTTATSTIALASPSPSLTASATSSPASTATAAGSGSASPAPVGTGATPGSNVCSLLQRADVEAVIGTLTTQPAKVDLPLPGFIASACIYASADGTLTVALGPRAIGRTEFESVVRLAPGAQPVSGIADSAFSLRADVPTGAVGAAAIVALKGTTYYTVQVTHRSKSSDALLTAVTDLAKKIGNSM